MESLSPAGSINGGTFGPTYGSDILFDVPHYNTYHEIDVLNYVAQETKYTKHLVSNNDSYDEITSNINVISYVDYMITIENDDAQYVPPPEQNNAMILSIIEQMKSQVERCNTVNQETKSVNESLSKLEEYCISLELSLQHNKEKMISDKSWKMHDASLITEINNKSFEITNLKAQLQEKSVAVNELKQLLATLKGKSQVTPNETTLLDSRFQKLADENVSLTRALKHIEILHELLDQARALKPTDENLDYAFGKFYDSDIEVAFRKQLCFIRNLDDVYLLSSSSGSNLNTILLNDTMTSSPICLLFKASKTKSWLWHRRLSHLKFGTIN
ncbi:hypothetical protein Tco_1010424 [Tanacetum coccineum]